MRILVWESAVGAVSYVHNHRGHVTQVTGPDGTQTRHCYDGINELLVREKPQAGSWRTKYVNALAQSDIGQVLARRTATGWSGGGVPSTWTDRYYHYDTLGNAVMESDHHGEVVAFVDMEAFGNVVAGGASGPRLTTKWSDPDTGLYYFNARWYDAGRGRWLQTEPLGIDDGPNLYKFAWNMPSVLYDPDGLRPLPRHQRPWRAPMPQPGRNPQIPRRGSPQPPPKGPKHPNDGWHGPVRPPIDRDKMSPEERILNDSGNWDMYQTVGLIYEAGNAIGTKFYVPDFNPPQDPNECGIKQSDPFDPRGRRLD